MLCTAAMGGTIRKALLLGAATAGLVTILYLEMAVGERTSPPRPAPAPEEEAEDDDPPELPPLDVGEDAPRLEEATAGEEGPGADNFACLVCHANYSDEALAENHARVQMGCADCHGQSQAHREDEENITPPDRMYARDDVNSFCSHCHRTHDVAPAQVVARWHERDLDVKPAQAVCTDCHGHHRLNVRTVRWDEDTGELLPAGEQQEDRPAGVLSRSPVFACCLPGRGGEEPRLRRQAEMLRGLGYDGAGLAGADELRARLSALEAADLELFQLCVRLRAVSPDPRLREVLSLLEDRPTTITLLVEAREPLTADAERRLLKSVGAIADAARRRGVRVALYPGAGRWPGGIDEAARAMGRLERSNVGVVLNLARALGTSGGEEAKATLKKVAPHLVGVTVEWADLVDAVDGSAGSGAWRQMFGALAEVGYRGPVGIRCTDLPGGVRGRLEASIDAWHRLGGGPARD